MANPDPDTLNYWVRDGNVLPPFMRGSVSGTANLNYWIRDGTILFSAAIQAPSSAVNDGFFLVFLQ